MSYEWTLSKLKPEDWDFQKEKLRDEELWSCVCYEFSREDEALRQAVAKSRKKFPDFVEKFGKSVPPQTLVESMSRPIPPLAYSMNPKWPDTPFRSLPPTRVGSRNVPESFPPSPRFYGVCHWTPDKVYRMLVGKKSFPGEWKDKDWAITPISTIWCFSEQADVAVFEIPWRWPDEVLKTGFAQWLKDHRPQGKSGDWRPVVKETRKPTGAAAEKRQLLTSLKALAAYRLLLCYKGDRQNARCHPKACEFLGKDFDNDSAWTDARKRAELQIASMKELNKASIEVEKFAGTPIFASTPNGLEAK